MFTSLKRIIKYGWKDFRRNKSLSASSIFVMVITVSLMSSLVLAQYSFKFLISKLQDQVDISVYFKENSKEQDILKIQQEFEEIPGVKEIEYVSKQMALNKFIESHRSNVDLMESLEEVGNNPLPPSLNIRVKEAAQYAQVSAALQGASYGNLIDKVDYYERKPVIDRVFAISSEIQGFGIFFSLLLIGLATVLIFNQVRLSIYSAKKEIEVMRLVGASNWFVRGPFLAQGVFIGGFASIITCLLFLAACAVIGPKLNIILPGLDIFQYVVNNFFVILIAQFAVGIGLGILSSMIATRKYINY